LRAPVGAAAPRTATSSGFAAGRTGNGGQPRSVTLFSRRVLQKATGRFDATDGDGISYIQPAGKAISQAARRPHLMRVAKTLNYASKQYKRPSATATWVFDVGNLWVARLVF